MDAKETTFYTTVIIVSILLGIIITYFIISIIRQHRRTLQLYKHSLQTEINTLEKERSRMAADLHDEVGPVLSAVKLRLNSLDIHNEADAEEVEKANEQIDALMKRMREISFDLMPNSLIRKGFPAALLEFIEYSGRNSKLEIRFKYEDVYLTQQQAINLYRINQEIIHNTIKHSGATDLMIELRQEKNCIILATRDNGKGFQYESSAKSSSGLGLRNLLSRTEILGGKMFVDSQKGKGTTYIFEIPIAENENNTADQNYSGR